MTRTADVTTARHPALTAGAHVPVAVAPSTAFSHEAVATGVCVEHGCEQPPAGQCSYVDSHGQSCRTRWCARHDGGSVGGLRYCRRHAGTMSALGSNANNPSALPDVGNRGASMVRWVFHDLDEAISAVLEVNLGRGEHLLRDRQVTISHDADGARAWEMGWKLAGASGIRVRIVLRVEEMDDAMIIVRLGDQVIASGTPPWVEARRLGLDLATGVDNTQRRDFYAFLVKYLEEAIGEAA